MELTPEDQKSVSSENLTRLIELEEDLIVDLALMHISGTMTVKLLSENANRFFPQGKPNEKPFLMVELMRINSLNADEYTNNTHPLDTFSDAAQHLAGLSFFCKLECFEAYHCLQMVDQRSVARLVVKFRQQDISPKRFA